MMYNKMALLRNGELAFTIRLNWKILIVAVIDWILGRVFSIMRFSHSHKFGIIISIMSIENNLDENLFSEISVIEYKRNFPI